MVGMKCELRQSEKVPPPALMLREFTVSSKKGIEEFDDAKIAFLDQLQATNRQWLDRMQSEVDLASELASKLTAARSIAEAMTAYQQWTARQLEVMAEDLAGAKSLLQTSARLLSDGWLTD
jgi:hypothetical protein